MSKGVFDSVCLTRKLKHRGSSAVIGGILFVLSVVEVLLMTMSALDDKQLSNSATIFQDDNLLHRSNILKDMP